MPKRALPPKPTRSSPPAPRIASATVRRAQHSVSLLPNQWTAIDRLGELTRWGRNGAVEEAVELLLLLPPNAVQQLALLRRTQMRASFKRHFYAVVQQALQATEAQAGAHEDPWTAYDASLETLLSTGCPVPEAARSAEQLASLAVREVAAHRRETRAKASSHDR